MRATSFSDFRKNVVANLDKVNDDCEPVIITRSNGKPAAVLMSIDHFASFEKRIEGTFRSSVIPSKDAIVCTYLFAVQFTSKLNVNQ